VKILSFLVNGEFFAVDVMLVQSVARRMTVTPVLAAPSSVIGIINIKGRVVTAFNLYNLLGYEERREAKRITYTVNAVVLKAFSGGGDQLALVMDKPGDLIDVDETAIRILPRGETEEENRIVARIAEVGDTLYRIVDVHSIA